MQTAIFGQSLHRKRNKAVRVNKTGYNVSLNVYLVLFWLTSFLKDNDLRIIRKVCVWGGGTEQGNQIIAEKKQLLSSYGVFSCIPMDTESLALDCLSLGSNYRKPTKQGSYIQSTRMSYPTLFYIHWLNWHLIFEFYLQERFFKNCIFIYSTCLRRLMISDHIENDKDNIMGSLCQHPSTPLSIKTLNSSTGLNEFFSEACTQRSLVQTIIVKWWDLQGRLHFSWKHVQFKTVTSLQESRL